MFSTGLPGEDGQLVVDKGKLFRMKPGVEPNEQYPQSILTGKIAVDYGVWGIPESFFIDRQGRITYKHVG